MVVPARNNRIRCASFVYGSTATVVDEPATCGELVRDFIERHG
jgi:hypothetical protein